MSDSPYPVSDDTLSSILSGCRTVAVVGISDRLGRPSLTVSSYLSGHGFTVYPVNPALSEVGRTTCYPSIEALPDTPDLCVIFRKAEDVPIVVEEALRKGIPRIWVQEGIRSPEGYRKAKDAGVTIVMDRCIMNEAIRLGLPEDH